MQVDAEYFARIVTSLARAIAHERVESYALRTLLVDPDNVDASIDIQNKARELAKERYDQLLQLVDGNSTEHLDPITFLQRFERLMQRE